MKLNVGKIAFPIEFDNGDKDVIYFNPNDPDLVTRLMASKDNIEKKINNVNQEDFNLLNDGTVNPIKSLEDLGNMSDEEIQNATDKIGQMTKLLDTTKKIVCDELDKAFDSKISEVVFKHCSPFAIINGEYFITQFINAITPEIQKHVKKSNNDMEKKMSKHINKYRK